MQIRIDVEDSSGTKLGYGPITSATDWKITTRLDRAGEFSFQMPMADPQYATLITGRNYVRCYELIAGTMTEIGLGIVDTIDEDSNADPSMATVSGSNIMRELTWRSVKGLLISESGYASPEDVHRVTLDSSGSGAEASPNNFLTLTDTFDGPSATWYDLTAAADPYQYVYFGYSRVFSEVDWTLHQINQTLVDSHTIVQYYDGSGWVDLTYTDGTSTVVGGQNICFGQDGNWTFTPPTDWVPLVQNCAATGDPMNNKTDYWLRFHLSGWAWDHVHIAEIRILTELPTPTGPQLIMALAPAGWTLTGYTTTFPKVYLQLADETVLEALNILAGITGEHFRLDGTASSRQLEWIGTDATDSGIVAMRNGEPAGLATNAAACMIQQLKTTHDSIDMVSRVIPYGAGQAGARTTLQYTARTAPAGYTLDAANNYIKYDAGEIAYGQVERVMVWSNIGPASAATADLAPAADALFDAAIYWLSTHSTVVDSYALTVYGLTAPLEVGDTIRVVWLEVASGVVIRNVDADLIILEAAYSLDQNGTYAAALMVSNLARWPMSETDAIAKLMGNVRAMSSISQSASIGTMSTPNLAVSVRLTAAGFGGLNYGS